LIFGFGPKIEGKTSVSLQAGLAASTKVVFLTGTGCLSKKLSSVGRLNDPPRGCSSAVQLVLGATLFPEECHP